MIALLICTVLFAAAIIGLLWSRQRAARTHLAERIRRERLEATVEERNRLLADLHDDIGAKLLMLVHALDKPEQADLARALMQDFRDVVSRTQQDACTLLQALGQIREETEQRLLIARGTLDWQQARDLPDPPLDEAQTLHLFRIAREAITNALRHGHARHIRVRAGTDGAHLILDLTDDGPGFAQPAPAGRGTAGMRQRAEQLQGSIDWTPGTSGGTKVVLQFPLPQAAP